MTAPAAELEGRRILVVEDEAMIAELIEEALGGLGCVIVGPVSRLEQAMKLAREEPIDAAVLDITIRGGQVYPVAAILMARRIPFLFASGYGDWTLPDELKGQPRLTKPYTVSELEIAVRAICVT